MTIKMMPVDFGCYLYTQNVTIDSSIFLQNIIRLTRQLFLLFEKSTTFWDNPRMLSFDPFCILNKKRDPTIFN